MSYTEHSSRYSTARDSDAYRYPTARDTDAYRYPRHADPPAAARPKLTTMRYSVNRARYPFASYDAYTPAKQAWPPSPSVEDETASLAKEVQSAAKKEGVDDHEPPTNTRGTVDQDSLLDDIEQPSVGGHDDDNTNNSSNNSNSNNSNNSTNSTNSNNVDQPGVGRDSDSDERRFVLVSEPSTGDAPPPVSAPSVDGQAAKADHDPPVFTKRISTPYAYTPTENNQKPLKPHVNTPTENNQKPLKPHVNTSSTDHNNVRPAMPHVNTSSTDHNNVRPSMPHANTSTTDHNNVRPSMPHANTSTDHNPRPSMPHINTSSTDYNNVRPSMPHANTSTDHNARPKTPYAYTPTPPDQHARRPQRESSTARDDVFDDSDGSYKDTPRRHTKRASAHYSFGKSHPQRDHPSTDRGESRERSASLRGGHDTSSTFSRDNAYSHSPRISSLSSLGHGSKKARPVPADTAYASTAYLSALPTSPLQRGPSPHRPSRFRESPTNSRPSSRGGNQTTPSTPLSSATTARPPSPAHVPVTEADWHATYPPAAATDRPPLLSRYGRHHTMPDPAPWANGNNSPLPYPADEYASPTSMPFDDHYRFGNSPLPSMRPSYFDSLRASSSSSVPGTTRESSIAFRPLLSRHDPANFDESLRLGRFREDNFDSWSNLDSRRERSTRTPAPSSMAKPLPTCPRGAPSAKYNDWYSLKGYQNFDICPTCYDGVFADTPFDVYFSQTRLYDRSTERSCDFSSPWMRLAWILTIKQRCPSLQLLFALADIVDSDRPCPDDREFGTDGVVWYGIPDQRDGVHVANFALCSRDFRMIEVLFPTMRGYFTRLPPSYQYTKSLCSLCVHSRRFPKYLDLLVELDAEAQSLGQPPNINRFIQLARDNAFKGECTKDKCYIHRPWHYIPSLPEFTVCEECYDELIWPAMQSKSSKITIPQLFNKTIQIVPYEDQDVGSSCALYSARMRRVWDTCVREDDFVYLERKAMERKTVEIRLTRERKSILGWMAGLERGSREWEDARNELKEVEREWGLWE